MNRYMYYGYPQAYPPFPAPPYYRNEDLQRRETQVLPKNMMYTTIVEPKFIEHLSQHIGLKIVVTTIVGKLIGTLDNVFIDHIALIVDGKLHQIRLGEIVFFEKVEEK